MPKAITDYWLKFYTDGLCTLCGNKGIIDTRGRATSPAGIDKGRLNYCICPNGQALRKGGFPLNAQKANLVEAPA